MRRETPSRLPAVDAFGEAKLNQTRSERLKTALRDNLKRRKAATTAEKRHAAPKEHHDGGESGGNRGSKDGTE